MVRMRGRRRSEPARAQYRMPLRRVFPLPRDGWLAGQLLFLGMKQEGHSARAVALEQTWSRADACTGAL